MNLGNRLISILKNKKTKVAGVVLLILTVLIIISACLYSNHIQEQRKRQEYEAKLAQEQFEKYTTLCNEYNSAVESYNIEKDRLNGLFDKLAKYNILEDTPELQSKKKIEQDVESKDINQSKINSLSHQIDNVITNTSLIKEKYCEICSSSYDTAIKRYEIISESYDKLLKTTSIDYIEGIPEKAETIHKIEFSPDSTEFKEEDILKEIDQLSKKTESLSSCYSVVMQITNPDEQWVLEKLKNIPIITGEMAVNKQNDPNNLLGKEGGYSACVYFTLKSIDSKSVSGNSIIDKGTDAGGAIEVYPDLDSAKNRCKYLSQFDNTLLYSGSYVIVGTMVVRTSYKLSDDEQVSVTNDIIKAFTTL